MEIVRILVAIFVLGVAAPALAEGGFRAAVDLHPIIPIDDTGETVGFGLDVRGGYAVTAGGLLLVPELVVGWNSFGTGDSRSSMSMVRVLGGARTVFPVGDGRLMPAAVLHFGYGSLSARMELPGIVPGMVSVAEASDDTGVIEFGGALDYAALDNLLVGGHAGLNYLTLGEGALYLTLGAQATYRF